MMSPLARNHHWMSAVKLVLVLFGILLQNHFCQTSGSNTHSRLKNMLFITAENITDNTTFPSGLVYHTKSGVQLCFNIMANKTNADCCQTSNFSSSCDTKISHSNDIFHLTLSDSTLSEHDIVILTNPAKYNSCMPSNFYKSTGVILNLHNCLKKGSVNIRLSQDGLCGTNVSSESTTCEAGSQVTSITFQINSEQKSCKKICDSPTTTKPTTTELTTAKIESTTATTQSTKAATYATTATTGLITTGTIITTTLFKIIEPEITLTCNISNPTPSPESAVKIMDDVGSFLEKMGNSSTAAIKMEDITGIIAKLSKQNQVNINFQFPANGEIDVNDGKDFSRTITIPKEACEMAVKKNASYAAVLLFQGMPQDGSSDFILRNEIIGIEMGAKISNLSQTIDIHYSNVNKKGNIASCVSWNGKGETNWITDGCKTEETNSSITCKCSHLTFFAILMSSPPTNISASDFKSLTQITEIGCGVSMFFLGVALFMHFLVRKNAASNAAKILICLFITMFTLNLSFLVNKSIAELNNFSGCLAIAVILHYSMLATFTWFSMQALHLYLSLRKFPAVIKHYMLKIYITGWVTPAVVVVPLLGLKKYGNIVIHVDDGTSANMCWIPDSAIQLGINITYYAIVFIFTFSIFVVTVLQIFHFQSRAVKVQDSSSTKAKFFFILGLFSLLGISWGLAFFSYGPLVIPSYYIFTVFNSFQGLLLFIYYYYSTKVIPEAKKVPENTNSTPTVTENIYTASPHG